ncbi:MAG: GAF domain-containing protein [Bacteroidaceae bacterium]|nr:GAF domain-containing protein [Bacteroidaceae bacterium]
MSENLIIADGSKEERYATLLPQLKALVESENDDIANMANISACIMDTFRFWWVGFYRVIDGVLVLGPFQGPLACTRIKKGKGVCGTAWQNEETIVVPDVEQFPGHIACSSLSKSEIVVPVFRNGSVIGVLDIDSENLGTFDETDRIWLEKVAALLDK